MMNHKILLTDKLRTVAEELARRRPIEYYGKAFEAWQQEVEETWYESGEPEGFLKICYKGGNKNESLQKS